VLLVTAIVEAFNLLDLLGAFVRGPIRLVKEQHRIIARDGSVKLLPVAESTAYGNQQVIETGLESVNVLCDSVGAISYLDLCLGFLGF
jgi:hypothetical protein